MSLKRIRGATIIGDLVFTSGMSGGTGDVETQIRTSLGKLEAALKEAGTSFEKVVKAIVYLADLNDRLKYQSYLGGDLRGESTFAYLRRG